MTGRRRRLAAAAGALLALLIPMGLALGAGRAEKVRLGSVLRGAEEIVAYDRSRALLLVEKEYSASAIARVRADGSLDPSFGSGGILDFPAADAVVMADGKILVASRAASPSDPHDLDARVTRLLADGSVDTSFGRHGSGYVDFGGTYDQAATLALAPDGKVIVGGSRSFGVSGRGFSDAQPAVGRLRPSGAVDRSFGRRGARVLSSGAEAGVFAVAAAPRGGVIAVGNGYLGTDVWKLTAAGELDRRFGEGGLVNVEGRGRRERYGWEEELTAIEEVGVVRGGKVLLAGMGARYGGDGTRYRALALRLRPDGGIDRSYGRRGWAMAGFRGWFFANALAVLRGGRLLVAGSAQVPIGKDSDAGIVAFDANGRLDRRVGNRGRVRIELGGWDSVRGLTARDGRAVLLGGPDGERDPWLARIPVR